jgi:UPF0755 protein
MRKARFFIIIFLLLCIGLFVWWSSSLAPVNATDKHTEIFVIEKGQGVKAIAKNLEEQKLIKNQTAFYLLVKKLGIENSIQAGSFRLSPSQSAEDIAKNLTKGSLDVWVTIPEGKRADEINALLQKNLPSYKGDWKEKLEANEGYLFPDTYLFPLDSTIDQIITIMQNNFNQKYKTLPNNEGKMTQNEIVTIASLIEREAKHDADRPLIASVIYNRLDLGMPLQIDATVQYILGYQTEEKSWWKRHLSFDDLAIRSAYNTYKNVGLPPTPIANPGIKSLQAALNPANTDYLFYITDKNGINHYAKTNDQQEANIARYGL